MKAKDLTETSQACQQVLATLLAQTRPIMDARFTGERDEVKAQFLSNLKAGVNNMAEALTDLSRRCDAAAPLWRLNEPTPGVYIDPVAKALLEKDTDVRA